MHLAAGTELIEFYHTTVSIIFIYILITTIVNILTDQLGTGGNIQMPSTTIVYAHRTLTEGEIKHTAVLTRLWRKFFLKTMTTMTQRVRQFLQEVLPYCCCS